MRAPVLAAIFAVLTMPVDSGAHRLDEYLQATRVSLARDRIGLEIDLTPGASIAADIIAVLDRDGDDAVSPTEARVYGEAVLRDLELMLDDRAVALTLSRVEVPPAGDMRGGMGTIQLSAAGRIEPVAAGGRRLEFRNNHRPEASVYLANALIPDDSTLEVVAQTRDPHQRRLGVEYDVRARVPMQLWWMLFGGARIATRIAAAYWL